jgi:hypothetical protein
MRLRLLLPRSRGGAGLRGLRAPWPALPATVALFALLLAGCGSGSPPRRSVPAPPAPAPAPSGPAFGITEDNADLLWPASASAPAAAAPFIDARKALTALHPRYVRLIVDWADLQSSPQAPPGLAASASGCAREVGPCGGYAGLAGELQAIAAQQRAARKEGHAAFEVVVDVLGAPDWAALPVHGCEDPATPASARPIAPDALGAYRALISSVLALGAREGVSLPWWSPWNEPNDARFLSPQRASCDSNGQPAAPAIYAQLARAMSAELKVQAPGDRILLGELGGYGTGSVHRLGIGEFVRALPASVLCLSDTWAVHAYASYGPQSQPELDPVAALESALAERGGCAAGARVWVTETGAGAPRPGRPRSGGAEGREACLALAERLAAWRADPHVEAVFQYTFRDDPAYPVGLISADLQRLEPVYGLWLDELRTGVLVPPAQSAATVCAP